MTCPIDQGGERLHCGKPIFQHNETLQMEEPRPVLALSPTSEPWSACHSPTFLLSLCHVTERGRRHQINGGGGERGRDGGTSEANLVFNERKGQIRSLPVKENIIAENGRTWLRRRLLECQFCPSMGLLRLGFMDGCRKKKPMCISHCSPALLAGAAFLSSSYRLEISPWRF